jgi:UDP-3-O-[3-hydroxymyristoyl] N-acetylglucosamine deacetylase/3-hydroxyacyl-[acyl-carrier-protein] dehydratase
MKTITNPVYDPCKEPVYDINKIKTKLNHRSPFLLVDKIMEINEEEVFGIKNVTFNEPFFTGHFPEEPIMPGVLIIEALGQCGGLLVLDKIEDASKYSTYFVKVDGFKFKGKVVPGDTLKLKLKLAGPIRHSMVTMNARAFVGDKIVAEGSLVAQVIKNKE